MTHERFELDPSRRRAAAAAARSREVSGSHSGAEPGLVRLQRTVGNAVVQRLMAQRSGDAPSAVEDDVAERIDRARGGGQQLDAAVQTRMADAMGQEFGDVNVHTSAESDALSRDLGARAFTTGNDVFFRAGAYDPHGSDGQRLIAHELTHVAQQRAGRVGGESGRMTVNPPGDAFEVEADAVADSVMAAPARGVAGGGAGAGAAMLQREIAPEEEDEIQAQMQPEDEEMTTA